MRLLRLNRVFPQCPRCAECRKQSYQIYEYLGFEMEAFCHNHQSMPPAAQPTSMKKCHTERIAHFQREIRCPGSIKARETTEVNERHTWLVGREEQNDQSFGCQENFPFFATAIRVPVITS